MKALHFKMNELMCPTCEKVVCNDYKSLDIRMGVVHCKNCINKVPYDKCTVANPNYIPYSAVCEKCNAKLGINDLTLDGYKEYHCECGHWQPNRELVKIQDDSHSDKIFTDDY